jgi:hypothetical protein
MHTDPSRTRVARLAACLLASIALVASCSSEKQRPENGQDAPSRASVDPNDPGPGARGGDASTSPEPTSDAGPKPPSCAPPPAPPAPPPGVLAIDVDIHAGRGPKGQVNPVQIDRRLYGMNVADWVAADYAPTPRPAYLSLLSALNPGVLRWPAGHRSQEYNWERGGAGQGGNWTLTAAHVDAFIALAKAVGAEPVIAINVKRGTTAASKDLLHYMNVEKGYGVKYLQIGNEPDLTDNMTASPQVYGNQLVAFVDALRTVDPNVKIVGPELLTGAHVGGMHDRVDWLTPVLIQAAGRINGISWHYYPLDSGQHNPTSSAIMSIEHLFQESAPDWRPASLAFADEVMPALGALRAAHAPNAEVWITELAEDPGPAAGLGYSDTLAGALWVGDVLGRYGEYGPGAVLRWLFKGSDVHAYGLVGPGDVPRPAYGAYWLYARHFGDRFVDATSSDKTEVAVHAALRPDGGLAVVLVNKKTEPRRVRVTMDGFAPCSAEQLTLAGAGYAATTFDINGQTVTDVSAKAGIPGVPVGVPQLLDIELPPTSMRMVVYKP